MDRFFKGLLSGIFGGLIMDIWGFLAKDILGFSTRNFVDWASVIIYGSLPEKWYEFLLAFATHLLWAGFLGILFAYLLPKVTSQGFRIKGVFFGFITGFFIYGTAILLRMPYFVKIPFLTSVSNAIGGLLWGYTTAHTLGWFDRKIKQ